MLMSLKPISLIATPYTRVPELFVMVIVFLLTLVALFRIMMPAMLGVLEYTVLLSIRPDVLAWKSIGAEPGPQSTILLTILILVDMKYRSAEVMQCRATATSLP